jgi:hypothetical protein
MEYRYSVIEAILSLNPDARGGTSVKKNDDIDNCVITWKEGISEISKEDIKAEMDRLKAEYDAQDYARKRKKEYPDIYDYIDGIVKSDQAQIDKYIADCQAVKDKYSKGA